MARFTLAQAPTQTPPLLGPAPAPAPQPRFRLATSPRPTPRGPSFTPAPAPQPRFRLATSPRPTPRGPSFTPAPFPQPRGSAALNPLRSVGQAASLGNMALGTGNVLSRLLGTGSGAAGPALDLASGALGTVGSLASLPLIFSGQQPDAQKTFQAGGSATGLVGNLSSLARNPWAMETFPALANAAPDWLKGAGTATLGSALGIGQGASALAGASPLSAAEALTGGTVAGVAGGTPLGGLAGAVGGIPLLPAIGTGLSIGANIFGNLPDEQKALFSGIDAASLAAWFGGPLTGIPASIAAPLLKSGIGSLLRGDKRDKAKERLEEALTNRQYVSERFTTGKEIADKIAKATSVADVLRVLERQTDGDDKSAWPVGFVVPPEALDSVVRDQGLLGPEGATLQRLRQPDATAAWLLRNDDAYPTLQAKLDALVADPSRLFVMLAGSDTQGELHGAELALTQLARNRVADLARAGQLWPTEAEKSALKANQIFLSSGSRPDVYGQMRWAGVGPGDIARLVEQAQRAQAPIKRQAGADAVARLAAGESWDAVNPALVAAGWAPGDLPHALGGGWTLNELGEPVAPPPVLAPDWGGYDYHGLQGA